VHPPYNFKANYLFIYLLFRLLVVKVSFNSHFIKDLFIFFLRNQYVLLALFIDLKGQLYNTLKCQQLQIQ